MLFLAAAATIYFLRGDLVLMRVCAVVAPFLAAITVYLQCILLRIDDEGISFFWPMQSVKRLKWDEIVQVRRSDAPPGRYFFIDLIASPDRSVLFNPFMFDRPGDIVRELNKHLRFELLGTEELKERHLSAELAAVADVKPNSISNAQWILIAVFILALIVGIYCIFK